VNTSVVALADQPSASARRTRTRLQLSWVTVVVAGAVIAYVDGFWVTSLQGAIGAVERNQPPFARWLRDSTLMLPLVMLGVVAALLLTRRLFGRSRRELVTLSAAALLIIVITSLISVAEVTASSVYDYHLQARDLGLGNSTHLHTVAPQPGVVVDPGACTGLCAARHATLTTHVTAVTYASMMMLITNVVLVLWVLALRGGRLWKRHLPPVAAAEASDGYAVTGAALA
jgi:hypothetical protein